MAGLLESEASPEMAPRGTSPEQVSDVSQQAKPVLNRAVELLYSENFENMVKMFQDYGEEGFAEAMAIAVNGVLERLEKDLGEQSVEILAEVGTEIIKMLLEDLTQGGVIQNVTKEMFMGALQNTIRMWGEKNPERFNPQEFQQALQQSAQSQGDSGGMQPEGGM